MLDSLVLPGSLIGGEPIMAAGKRALEGQRRSQLDFGLLRRRTQIRPLSLNPRRTTKSEIYKLLPLLYMPADKFQPCIRIINRISETRQLVR